MEPEKITKKKISKSENSPNFNLQAQILFSEKISYPKKKPRCFLTTQSEETNLFVQNTFNIREIKNSETWNQKTEKNQKIRDSLNFNLRV